MDNISNRCDIDMITDSHHAEAALLAERLSGTAHAVLALDDTFLVLVDLAERQTAAAERQAAALERLAAALEGEQPARSLRLADTMPRPRTALTKPYRHA